MRQYPIVRLPGDEPYHFWKLYPDTIPIQYGVHLYCFLLLGEERALLIDTGYGRGDFPNIVQRLADGREIVVVNTHGHYDHTGGNPWFPRVHMHPNAMAYAKEPFDPVDPAWLANMPYPDYEMIPVNDGHVFDIGGRKIEVIYAPAHSDSSLMFIDHGRRLLFTGDEFDSEQAALPRPNTIEQFHANMLRLQTRKADFDFIMPSHNGCPINPNYLDDFEVCSRHVLEGHPDFVERKDLPVYADYVMKRVQVGLSSINYLVPKEEA